MVSRLIRCCRYTEHFLSRIFCVVFLIIQAASINYYLVEYENTIWSSWAAADFVIIIVFIITFTLSYRFHIRTEIHGISNNKMACHQYLAIFVWGLYTGVLAAKVGYFFFHYVPVLDESDFFGPNTLKTTVAMAGVIYLLLLSSLHDADPGTPRRKFIDDMTSTVLFDILDCVESLEILFLDEARKDLLPQVEIAIIAIACFNFFLPILPLMTLCRTNFGHKKILSHFMIIVHKLLLAFLVNLPLLICRMIIWHGISHGVSIFSLKNCIIITVVIYDLYETYAVTRAPSAIGTTRGRSNKPPKANVNGVQRYVLTIEDIEERLHKVGGLPAKMNGKVASSSVKRNGIRSPRRDKDKPRWKF